MVCRGGGAAEEQSEGFNDGSRNRLRTLQRQIDYSKRWFEESWSEVIAPNLVGLAVVVYLNLEADAPYAGTCNPVLAG